MPVLQMMPAIDWFAKYDTGCICGDRACDGKDKFEHEAPVTHGTRISISPLVGWALVASTSSVDPTKPIQTRIVGFDCDEAGEIRPADARPKFIGYAHVSQFAPAPPAERKET